MTTGANRTEWIMTDRSTCANCGQPIVLVAEYVDWMHVVVNDPDAPDGLWLPCDLPTLVATPVPSTEETPTNDNRPGGSHE